VLGFYQLEDYLAARPDPYMGAIIGRVAGRIAGACFTIEGRSYSLAANEPRNHLHGGRMGLDKRVWNANPVVRPDGAPSLRLTYRSPDGEEGYPGTVDISVTYTLTRDNALHIDTEAIADRVTPLCLTNHSYFNLAGEGAGSIADHELQIHSDTVVAIDQDFTLLGRRIPVDETNDFNHPRRLGNALPHLAVKHGDFYLVRRPPAASVDATPELVPIARLSEPGSRRVLTVSTTENCVQFYNGWYLAGDLIGKSGKPYRPYSGLCLECQGYPNGCDDPSFGNILLHPGQPARHTTRYLFSTY
jgi:aldose 1-epimerase